MPERGVDAVILAGGAGSRAGGVDKGWILHAGRPLVALALERLRGEAATVWISANRQLARYAALGVPVLAEGAPGAGGPLGGIARGLAASRAEWMLSIPVDAPGFPADLLPRLLEAARRHGQACVAEDAEREQPLFAIYPCVLAARAAAAVRAGELAVWRFLRAVEARPVRFDAGSFSNLNAAGLG